MSGSQRPEEEAAILVGISGRRGRIVVSIGSDQTVSMDPATAREIFVAGIMLCDHLLTPQTGAPQTAQPEGEPQTDGGGR